jgi:surface antigen
MQPFHHKDHCKEYYNGLLNANLMSSLKGIISYLDNFMTIHDNYIEAYNEQYELGNIGNGKNWDATTNADGFRFELYPKSHPVLRH